MLNVLKWGFFFKITTIVLCFVWFRCPGVIRWCYVGVLLVFRGVPLVFWGVPLFSHCSGVFRCSAGVPCSGVPGFIVSPSEGSSESFQFYLHLFDMRLANKTNCTQSWGVLRLESISEIFSRTGKNNFSETRKYFPRVGKNFRRAGKNLIFS